MNMQQPRVEQKREGQETERLVGMVEGTQLVEVSVMEGMEMQG